MTHAIHRVTAFEIVGPHTLVWPNGADFDPATLHDWPDVADDFAALAKRWAETKSREAI